jgi:hypothetical protein
VEISEIRQRVLQTIAESRRAAAARRARADAASAAYETFLERVAMPIFKQFASVLKAEHYPFQVFTPGGSLRLASDRTSGDFIEIVLDVSGDEPVVLGRTCRTRGSRALTSERVLSERTPVAELADADVLEFLLREIRPFVER